jgi:benzoate/toluate 1,2-dioxygenase alpha subunit
MDQFGSQIRVLRPLSPSKTEVTIYCIAPVGEDKEARTRRIRQYEDFFNASGMATPDDLEEFRACQAGYAGIALEWNDMSRGSKHWIQGPDEAANEIGLKPKLSGIKTEDEGLYLAQHEHWLHLMKEAITSEKELAATEGENA